MAVTSAVQICSNASLSLGGGAISDFAEGTPRALLAAQLYPSVLETTLRDHTWNCAIKRVNLSPESTTPAFDWSFQYVLPSDWVRTLGVGERGAEDDYLSEGRRILANVNPLRLRYVFLNDVPATYDASLVQALELAMAAKMAYAITKSTSERDSRFQLYQNFIKRARAIDGQDDPPQTLGDAPLLQARFTGFQVR